MQLTVTRRLIKQKARRQPSRDRPRYRPPTACRHTVSELFHSPLGVLFTFPSRYLSTIGHSRVFSLGEWSPQIQTGFHVSGPTQVPILSARSFAYGAITLYRSTFQKSSARVRCSFDWSYNPNMQAHWFGLIPFRSPLLRESRFDFFSSAY